MNQRDCAPFILRFSTVSKNEKRFQTLRAANLSGSLETPSNSGINQHWLEVRSCFFLGRIDQTIQIRSISSRSSRFDVSRVLIVRCLAKSPAQKLEILALSLAINQLELTSVDCFDWQVCCFSCANNRSRSSQMAHHFRAPKNYPSSERSDLQQQLFLSAGARVEWHLIKRGSSST